jgi:hypothetical protein
LISLIYFVAAYAQKELGARALSWSAVQIVAMLTALSAAYFSDAPQGSLPVFGNF